MSYLDKIHVLQIIFFYRNSLDFPFQVGAPILTLRIRMFSQIIHRALRVCGNFRQNVE